MLYIGMWSSLDFGVQPFFSEKSNPRFLKVHQLVSFSDPQRWLCCKCFFGDVIFALTAWTLSGNHLHTNWCKTLKIDVFIQNENKCTNRQKKTILSKLHQSRCRLTATAKFLMSTKVFLNSCHVLQDSIILGKLYSMCFVSPLIYFVKGNIKSVTSPNCSAKWEKRAIVDNRGTEITRGSRWYFPSSAIIWI